MTDKEAPPMKHWTQYVLRRIEKNQNFVACITGATGSGKSYAALAWAEELDPSFSVERVVFTPAQFMELVNSERLQRGSVILFDEIGVAINSKEHMSIVNRSLNFFMQTFRHRNWILLMTTPHIQFLDAGVRRLIHSHAETVGINHRTKRSRLKIFSLSVGQYNGKIYRKYLRVLYNKRLAPIHRVGFGLPSPALRDAYEAKKLEFTKALNQRIAAQVRRQDEKELGKVTRPVLTDMQERVLSGLREGLTLELVAKRLGVTSVQAHKKALERKGFRFKPVMEGRVLRRYVVEGGA